MAKKRKSKPLKNESKKAPRKARKKTAKKIRTGNNKKSGKGNSKRKGTPKKKVISSKNKGKVSSSKSNSKAKAIKNAGKSKPVLRFEFPRNKDDKRKAGNTIIIQLPQKSFQAKVKAINNWDGAELKRFVNRFSKFPQAIQVILTTKKGRDTFQRASKISPFDFVVSVDSTKKFILEMLVAFQDNYLEYIESQTPLDSDWVYNPSKIIAVTVRFIY